ncbi:MAG: 30S ribosomal protein S3 [Patescibacteria group bacterium]|nr:30S ribosomal protein S3 [Patescibacteria group bacterium]MDD5121049.1 30S ribosomal protein S3 [Patescibacteria group bacterium]MDD5221589.1 30S ribosomal protein S3 [Patescibacteria group bacterium]MDD5396032.1 30S ribosomal protein S3 [Patescibacteria group bacterium]
MGQKINPKILRIPTTRDWEEKWFAKKQSFRQFLREDIQIRKLLTKKLKGASVDKTIIERSGNAIKIFISTAKPGVIIGRGGVDAEKLKKDIQQILLPGQVVDLNISEVPSPFLSAQIVLEAIVADLEKRVSYRRAMKRAMDQVKKGGAGGVKIKLSGRLDGVEIARRETLTWGKMPLHTIRADIDYSRGAAHTMYGAVGVKVWIYRGEIFNKIKKEVKK